MEPELCESEVEEHLGDFGRDAATPMLLAEDIADLAVCCPLGTRDANSAAADDFPGLPPLHSELLKTAGVFELLDAHTVEELVYVGFRLVRPPRHEANHVGVARVHQDLVVFGERPVSQDDARPFEW